MEIYLLREEKQVGPYGTDDVRSWLNHGQVSASELAWAPGLDNWVPLETILEPEPIEPEPEPEPVPEPIIAKPLPPATAQQKAFLSYMGASFTAHLTEGEAEVLVSHVSKDPKLAARLTRWEEDKLDLYPEMFTKEIQARRENRPAYFHKLVQTEGGDCFTGVTKAHCQVLMGYLDVNHPRWDANLRDATWHYFFPAIAEKFPQLVHKEWRPKLKFKDGPKVAAELLEEDKSAASRRSRGGVNFKRVFQSVAALLMIGLAAGAVYGWLHPEKVPAPLKAKITEKNNQFLAFVRGDEPVSVPKIPAKKVAAEPGEEPADKSATAPATVDTKPGEGKPAEPAPATVTAGETKSADPSMAKPADPAMAMTDPKPADAAMGTTPPKPADPAMAGTPAMADSPAPAPQPKPTTELFNPNANNPATSPTTVPPAPPSVAVQRTDVRTIRPIPLQSKYGTVTINPGTSMKIVAHEGDWLTLNHMGQAIRVPVSWTDFGQ